MNDIMAQVKKVSDLIVEITSATEDQRSGVAQVDRNMGALDQITQHNAALVEQGAAAAESLKHQATRLVNAVSVFR